MENIQIIHSKYDGTSKLNGIVKKIRDSSLVLGNLVSVSSSKVFSAYSPIYSLTEDDYPFTSGDENPYVTYNFIDKKLFLESYSLLTVILQNLEEHFPRHWVIKGSNDNISWKTIDVRNTEVFKRRNQSEIFYCKKPGAYSYIKMMQTGLDSMNTSYLRIQQIEFFGTLFPKEYDFYPSIHQRISCRQIRKSSFIGSLLVFICLLTSK